ncbi:putative succinate--CoA ligase (ADP-forming) [Helianthus annuus]|uniref:Succinate--CoA ligase (ADP-forming) n=1 Tax=Helianthus annuus TaxID=4232 RepID=A0A251S798_HELAN|nr:putative succinate--CoA ligase (ADP-forming) [Helianthus annuus]KAJ0450669.1 putative succinate--CoA ligase (ADP-forming) [Helianthus annuus]KAJ0454906.1 putative succinate--CoA ligase (ADP-forming) [Helianthus annuus]KAJ0472517.1 putative succinate--CoA ligase (ADP-forming) [Helianthus annuus]KAJ0648119.1 putative succinate--CoA ligase (ADP-forming) [Helianthus annuus]
MVGGLFNKLALKSLKVAGKWQQQQLRRLNIHEYQLLLYTSGPDNAISMVHLVEICHNFDSCELVNDHETIFLFVLLLFLTLCKHLHTNVYIEFVLQDGKLMW